MFEVLSGDGLGLPIAELAAVQAQQYLTEVAAEEARRALRVFSQRAWVQLLPTPPTWNWHMDAICDHLAYVSLGEIRFLMISVPPRHSKSMLASILWPAWHWLHYPGEQYLTASVDDQLSRDSSILCRRLIESPWYQNQWPDQIELYNDENHAGMYRNTKGGYRLSVSLQSRVTGVGGTTQLLDDPHDAKKIESDAVRHSALAWHDNAWRSRVNDPERSKKVYIGQRTHDNDIFGHVIEQEGKRWVQLVLSMEFDPQSRCITFGNPTGDGPLPDAEPIFKDPREKELEILDPKRMSAKTAAIEKDLMSERGWQAQYNQRPTGAGGLILKRKWWRPWIHPDWRANLAGTERPMPKFTEIIQVWDTALEEDEQDDYSACTTWGLFQYTEQFWDAELKRPVQGSTRKCAMMLDAFKEHLAYPDLRKKAIELNNDFAPDPILIEKKVSGHSLLQELRRKSLPVKAVTLDGSAGKGRQQGDLVARAHSASLMLEKGCIFYPPRPFAYKVIEEASKFPNAEHDDFVSTLVIAWMYLRRYHDLQLPDDETDEIAPWSWKKLPGKKYA
jgi:phage terminase large subunit-like protein